MAPRNRNQEYIQSNIPIPDPSLLTTQQLTREITSLREFFESQVDSINNRISSVIKIIDANPAIVDAEISKLQQLQDEKFRSIVSQFDEKFRSIAIQFSERDIRTEQTSRDSKVAVDAALQAAKEAVGEQNKSSALAIAKSEAATTKQIDQIGVIISTMANGLNDKIDDIKSRITIIEGRNIGGNNVVGYAITAVAVVISIIAVFVTLLHH